MRPCWIITYSRTGSTYLSRLLNSTKLFDPLFREHYLDQEVYQHDPPRYAKVMYPHYVYGRSIGAVLNEFYPDMRFVYNRRRDLVATAVSRYFVRMTGIYSVKTKRALRRYQAITVPYDPQRLLEIYQNELERHIGWNEFAESHNALPVFYENVVSDPEGEISRIMQFLEVDQEWRIDVHDNCMMLKLDHPQKPKFTDRLRDIL